MFCLCQSESKLSSWELKSWILFSLENSQRMPAIFFLFCPTIGDLFSSPLKTKPNPKRYKLINRVLIPFTEASHIMNSSEVSMSHLFAVLHTFSTICHMSQGNNPDQKKQQDKTLEFS